MITARELYARCLDIASGGGDNARQLHETLAMAAAEGTRRLGRNFGNLFAQVDCLCREHGVAPSDRAAIQAMRRRSNRDEALSGDELMYNVKALCLFISAVFGEDVPSQLTTIIPHADKPQERHAAINLRYVRCVVESWDETIIKATTDDDNGGRQIEIDYSTDQWHDLQYLRRLLTVGMQLNLLDCHAEGAKVRPGVVVVEPDFLIDISAVAACFADYGNSPLAYTINRLAPKANSQPILLGNLASQVLDDMIHNDQFHLDDTIVRSFRAQAMQFCTCEDFNADKFRRDAQEQATNIGEVVRTLFGGGSGQYDRAKALLEASFVCERLGLQGRADMMTTDFGLLVEQKSGKRVPSRHGFPYSESHYVQLLLYYGVLRYNFGVEPDKIDMRLLYSKYPATEGLLAVNFYRRLFLEAMKVRNRIVAGEYLMARKGFGAVAVHLTPGALVENGTPSRFFEQYIRPQVEAITQPLQRLSPLERAYFERMATFVYREQIAQRVGAEEGVSGCMADLWNMPLAEKRSTGNIYTGLTIMSLRQSTSHCGLDLVELRVPWQSDDFLPNFRRGDIVYLYNYSGHPDVRHSILHKGVMETIETERIVVRLSHGQQSASLFPQGTYAVEHGAGDASSSASLRSLHAFICSPRSRRDLLLGQREPTADTTVGLSRQYNPSYDDIILKAKQARDYFLLVGPPGTGKTSMALRFLVEEELASAKDSEEESKEEPAILLMAYTNRAVDEICAMLADTGLDYLRIGNESTCDPRFADHLVEAVLERHPRLSDIRNQIIRCPIVVGTTSTLLARPFVFGMKKFTLTIVDEASQILEPGIVGLLTGRFILVGDHKQLPAVVAQGDDESAVADPLLQRAGIDDCRQSLFERLVRWESRQGRTQFVGTLRRQGRMHPDIARFPVEMFYSKERLVPVPCRHQEETEIGYAAPSVDRLDDLLRRRRMMFLPVEAPQDGEGKKSNAAEARLVADLLRRIHRFYGERFDAAKTVGVIVPYRNQISMIRRETALFGIAELSGISIDTVERYQGSQRDVIIYSFTVTRPYQLAFLTSNTFMEEGHPIDRKLNVALTRARKQMILIGCEKVLKQNPLFRELIEKYAVEGWINGQ